MNRRRQPLEALNRWLSAFGQPGPDGTPSRFWRFLRTYLVYYPVLRPAYLALGVYRVHLASPRTFTFSGREYTYFHRWYGRTFGHERAVEIPIVWSRVREHSAGDVLEVGNVLSHYFPCRHVVVDKYERAPAVLNEDVVSFSPGRLFSLIVSISTLEHVGWDETPREPRKTLRALEHLTSLLEPGGELVVTFPLGYNPHLDGLLREGEMVFTETRYLKRVSLSNTWREVDWGEIEDAHYGYPYHGGNAVVVGVVRRPAASGIAPAGAS